MKPATEENKQPLTVYEQLEGYTGETLREGIHRRYLSGGEQSAAMFCGLLAFILLCASINFMMEHPRISMSLFAIVVVGGCYYLARRDNRRQEDLTCNKNVAYLMACANLESQEQLPAFCKSIDEDLRRDHTPLGGVEIGENWAVGRGWVIPTENLRGVFCYDAGGKRHGRNWQTLLIALGGISIVMEKSSPPQEVYYQLLERFPYLIHGITDTGGLLTNNEAIRNKAIDFQELMAIQWKNMQLSKNTGPAQGETP